MKNFVASTSVGRAEPRPGFLFQIPQLPVIIKRLTHGLVESDVGITALVAFACHQVMNLL